MSKVTVENDASMEDVLASIRRIISDDMGGEENLNSVDKSPQLSSNPLPLRGRGRFESEDVLDLTDVVTPNGTIIRLKPRQANGINAKREDGARPEAVPQPVQEAIFSDETALKSLDALKDLTRLNEKVFETVRDGPFGRQTMEEFIVSMMKPMLKTWMDANLPSLVKWVVAEQIEKLLKEQKEGSPL